MWTPSSGASSRARNSWALNSTAPSTPLATAMRASLLQAAGDGLQSPRFLVAGDEGVVSALVDGCRKIPGQTAYYRALAGLQRALPRGLEAPELAQHYPASVRRGLRDSELRRRVDVRPLISAQLPLARSKEAFDLALDRTRSTKVQLISE